MRITIYQIIPELDQERLMFMPLSCFQKAGYPMPPAGIYESVFCGETEAATLEEIYRIFNRTDEADTRYLEKMELSDRRPFGGEQMICLCLEMMLVKMMRRLRQSSSPPVAPPRLKSHPDTYERICQYLATHVRLKVTIEQICKDNQVGRTQLQNLFRERNGCGVIDYFCNLKIETAKQQ